MNRHSVFFKLNILFVIALFATLIAGGSIMIHMVKKDRTDMLFKARFLMHEQRVSQRIPAKLLEEFHLTPVQGEEKRKVLRQKYRTLKESTILGKRGKIIHHKGHLYLHLKNHRINVLLRDERSFWQRFSLPFLLMSGTIILLISMYILLRRTLVPLKQLHRDIERYGEGTLNEYAFSDKRDEISRVSNAFYTSVSKIKRLTDSRTLFIRNLFHELNTPVTKGKILAEIVEEPKTKSMLDAIFTRLASLLKELAQVEQITSENYKLSMKDIRIIDIIDEAKDLLYLEHPIPTNVTDQVMKADFASMSIVFKNLIDNALKYGQDLEVIYKDDTLSFVSSGEALKGDFGVYLEAFSQKKSSDKSGFGLGLYIANEVIRMHGMKFEYRHEEGKNRFTIDFKKRL